ncbi:MAG: histidine kinase [Bacteroidota bacterium]
MVKKLIYTAILTSPLIALYGVMPIYLSGQISREESVLFGGVIALNVLIHWAVNIFLVVNYGHVRRIYLYLFGYLFTIILRLPLLILFAPNTQLTKVPLESPIYPIVNSIVVYIIIWVIIETFRSGEATRQLQTKMNQLTIENLEAQQQTLKNQLQPHFMFNALSVLKSLVTENTRLAEKYVLQLSDFLRYSFENQTINTTTLQKELAFTESYLQLQAIRFENAFSYIVDLPENILTQRLPVFSLQSLVENIFKHNYFNENNPMTFSITYEQNRLKIWNKKVGFKVTERKGVGLKNLEKRYALVADKTIEIDDTDNYFCVTIPLLVP